MPPDVTTVATLLDRLDVGRPLASSVIQVGGAAIVFERTPVGP